MYYRFQKIKSRAKPFFKQMIKLRENVLLRKKIFKFKRQKWNTFVFQARRKLLKRYLKYKVKDIQGYSVSAKPNRWTGLKGRHRNILHVYKRFRLFYGLFSRKAVKRIIRKVKKRKVEKRLKLLLLRIMERRLDAVIYRSKFSYTPKSARQLIMHGNVKINGKVVTNPAFITYSGDLVQLRVSKRVHVDICHRSMLRAWPHPPSHLNINYKTLTVIVGEVDYPNLSSCFHFELKPENMILDFFYQ